MGSVLLGQSYFLRFDPKLWAAQRPYPPLGTLYAAAYLRERGNSVALFDAMLARSEDEWDLALVRVQPRYAVLYEDNFNYLSKMCLLRMRQAAMTMLAMAKRRGCITVAAGADATDHPELYLEAGADYVLIGEGEATLAELLAHLDGSGTGSLETIRGLAYRAGAGSAVQRTARRPDLTDLDALPFPAWDLVNVPRYRAIWHQRHGTFSMNMVTTRGCPYHCNWCAKPIWGQRYNVRSPENVVAELAWLAEHYHPDHIWFADDIFGLRPGWVEHFADLVEQRGVRTPFKSLQRVDLLLKEGTVAALRRAGAATIWVGAESGSQHVLDAMDKGTRVEQIAGAAALLRRAGIQVGFFLQFGYPGETRADIDKTLQMVRDCRPDDIGMSVSYPLPGTKFYASVQRELGTRQNWDDSADLAMLYHGPFSTAFYRQLHVVLHKEFRSQRTLVALRAALRRPLSVRPRLMRRIASMLWSVATLPLARRKLDALEAASRQAAPAGSYLPVVGAHAPD
jgi:radical SAM superfamily enzyme YgiQ (UPF0313 family)